MHITHVNLARGFSGGERQTALLIDYLATVHSDTDTTIGQTLVCRNDSPLRDHLKHTPGLTFIRADHMFHHLWGGFETDLLHAHDAKAVHWAFLRTRIHRNPYIVTRRVPNPLKKYGITPMAYRKASAVVAISRKISENLRQYDSRLEPVLIPSAAGALPFREPHIRELRERLKDRFVIGHIGMLLDRQKGQRFLIEAARLLKDQYPDMHFMLVGRGEDEEMLKSLAAGLENLEFTGFTEFPGDYLSVMDLFIFPSNYEGLGSSLLDAMDFGVPVIATKVGGIPDIVRDGENGLLIEPRNGQAIADAITRLYEHPNERKQFADAGKDTAARYSSGCMGREYLKLYRSILSSRTHKD